MWIELLLSYDANGLFWHHKKGGFALLDKPLVITHHLHYIIRDSASSEVPVLLFLSFPSVRFLSIRLRSASILR